MTDLQSFQSRGGMLLVGLTGGIASGKSTVAHALQQLGMPLIDTDLIARQVVEPGSHGWKQLKEAFGDSFFDSVSGELVRDRLGAHVFGNVQARHKLNGIMQPLIRTRVLLDLIRLFVKGHRMVLLDCPLLVETGAYRLVHKVLVVSCSEQTQLRRLQDRNGFTEQEARARISSQCSAERREATANYVIRNEHDSMPELLKQVQRVHEQFTMSYIPWFIRATLVLLVASATAFMQRLIF